MTLFAPTMAEALFGAVCLVLGETVERFPAPARRADLAHKSILGDDGHTVPSSYLPLTKINFLEGAVCPSSISDIRCVRVLMSAIISSEWS